MLDLSPESRRRLVWVRWTIPLWCVYGGWALEAWRAGQRDYFSSAVGVALVTLLALSFVLWAQSFWKPNLAVPAILAFLTGALVNLARVLYPILQNREPYSVRIL